MVTRNRAKWTMLRIYLINFVLVLVLAGNASATAHTWDGGVGLWSTPAKWTPDSVPLIADTAQINVADANCLIDSTVDACCATLDVGNDTGPCYLNMTDGALTSSGNLVVGHSSSGTTDTNGVFIMSGGTVSTTGNDARLWIGYGDTTISGKNSFGTLIMTGGVMNINGTKIEVGKNITGNGRMYISGGTLNLNRPDSSADFEMGKVGNATLVMTAGDVNILDCIKLAETSGTATIIMSGGNIYCGGDLRLLAGTPKIYLDGGDVNCSTVLMSGTNAKIDITEGKLIVRTDSQLVVIQGYISDGKIIGYGGAGIVDVTPEGGGVGWITVTARLGDPNLAWSPSPGNYATVEWTPAGPTLSWKPGRYAAKHDVYFGTDKADVNDANNTSPEFKGKQDPCTFAFPSPPPVLDETYYWRIDEVNDACAPNIWKGDVWQFTMANYEVVEDFDSYANDAALRAVWALTGGSTISRETTIVQSGNSMKYKYTSGSATEAYANTTGANKLPVDINDWTTAGIKALTLYFYGDGDNSAEKMYVALRSTDNNLAVVYYGYPDDLKEPEWHEWNIKLSDFTGVNLHSIAKVYVGFGNRGSPPTNGGTVYFDDIRLYPRRCVASRLPAGFGDVDGDCDVDFADVNIMANDWLKMDYNGVGHDGVLKGGASWVDDGGYPGRGRCVQLDGTNGWVDLDDSDFSNFHNKTIAFWVKVRAYSGSYPYMFYFNNGIDNNPYRIYFQTHDTTSTPLCVRVRFVEDYSSDFTAGQDVWRHLALVLVDTEDGKCTGEFYGDGGLVAFTTMPGRPRHSGGAIGVNLGSANDGSSGFVNAVFDDFRVYDRALSEDEIGVLAGGGEGPTDKMLLRYTFDETTGLTAHNSSTYKFYHPLLSDAELYEGEAEGYRVVNFKDLAILANSWLEEQLWP